MQQAIQCSLKSRIGAAPVTASLLLEEGLDGIPHCVWAAQSGCLEEIPQDIINEEVVLARDQTLNGTTLHFLAGISSLHLVPDHLMTHANLSMRDRDGNTVYHISALMGFETLPGTKLTSEVLFLQNHLGYSITHAVVQHDAWREVPMGVLNSLHFLQQDVNGCSPLHLVAHTSVLLELCGSPATRFLITDEVLDLADNDGNTIFHLAASAQLPCIPDLWGSDARFACKNNDGETPFDIKRAAESARAIPV